MVEISYTGLALLMLFSLIGIASLLRSMFKQQVRPKTVSIRNVNSKKHMLAFALTETRNSRNRRD